MVLRKEEYKTRSLLPWYRESPLPLLGLGVAAVEDVGWFPRRGLSRARLSRPPRRVPLRGFSPRLSAAERGLRKYSYLALSFFLSLWRCQRERLYALFALPPTTPTSPSPLAYPRPLSLPSRSPSSLSQSSCSLLYSSLARPAPFVCLSTLSPPLPPRATPHPFPSLVDHQHRAERTRACLCVFICVQRGARTTDVSPAVRRDDGASRPAHGAVLSPIGAEKPPASGDAVFL